MFGYCLQQTFYITHLWFHDTAVILAHGGLRLSGWYFLFPVDDASCFLLRFYVTSGIQLIS